MQTSIAVLGLACALFASQATAEMVLTTPSGRIAALSYDDEYLDVGADLLIPPRGWRSAPGLSEARDVQRTESGGTRGWTGRIEVEKGKFCRYSESLQESDGAVAVSFTVTAETDLDVEGVFCFVDVPMSVFAGGPCALLSDGSTVKTATMPAEQPPERHFLSGTGDAVRMADARGNVALLVSYSRPCAVTVQDTRDWNGRAYQAYALAAPGPLRAGQTAPLAVTLRLTGEADRSPAHFTVTPERELYRFDGFGGDYCFNIESPVTAYTLDNLNVRWARTEMTLSEWEPQNENPDANQTDWAALKAHDQPGSDLHREFLLAQEIQRRGIPYVISIWNLPDWLYGPQGEGRDGPRVVPPGRWPELLECIGSYLVYARDTYGVEPGFFSFNEPEYGVRVKLTPEEHRAAIKSIGAHLTSLGLKTKMLLGDVASPHSLSFCLPASRDPDALRYVGAVAFHSWGGATQVQYAGWAELARKLGLPLLVTELGVDANWRSVPLGTFRYALDEVRMYQELIQYAHPQGTMQWEFTADYSIVDVGADAAGQQKLVPTKRFYFVKHFCNLTPTPAAVLAASSDNGKALITAFRGAEGTAGPPAYTFHIANFGAGREARLDGLPAALTELRAVRTSEQESFIALGRVQVAGGGVSLTLAPNSLLTLTTLP